MKFRSKNTITKLERVIQSRIDSGEITKREAFEICVLRGLEAFEDQLRWEILREQDALNAKPKIAVIATATPKPRSKPAVKKIILRGFEGLVEVLAKKAA